MEVTSNERLLRPGALCQREIKRTFNILDAAGRGIISRREMCFLLGSVVVRQAFAKRDKLIERRRNEEARANAKRAAWSMLRKKKKPTTNHS